MGALVKFSKEKLSISDSEQVRSLGDKKGIHPFGNGPKSKGKKTNCLPKFGTKIVLLV